MIYVTVGTTHFDALIRAVDHLAEKSKYRFVCQIGNGRYIPRHAKHFRYDPEHWRHADDADYVISHGGTGSVLYLIRRGIPFIAVANKALQDDHQTEFLTALSGICELSWTDHPENLEHLLSRPPQPVKVEAPDLASGILHWLNDPA